ncbi:MAG: nucleotidyltransferase domain-containing protein [Chloroflexi bacterium]|nr:nucleotidyltransferase domain-containing protein [Chloroflexota bacterium]MCL5275940.1 nucleotidyltransferase domain-containing protein [Chloroflexota bacterium]
METRDYRYYLEVLRNHLPELRQKYHVKSLGVFGSYVRGEQHTDSDLDILVDLVMVSSLKPNIGRRILREVVTI